MSIGSPGILGAFAAQSLAQSHQAQVQPQGQSTADHARHADSAQRASDAAGIGRTDADEQAGDRDADGRRMLERILPGAAAAEEVAEPADEPRQSRDATGHSGTQLDLSG